MSLDNSSRLSEDTHSCPYLTDALPPRDPRIVVIFLCNMMLISLSFLALAASTNETVQQAGIQLLKRAMFHSKCCHAQNKVKNYIGFWCQLILVCGNIVKAPDQFT